jgi:hypothetical protein
LAGQVRIGTPDASLTPASGVVAVAELVGRLGVVEAFDDAVGPVKQRDRGLTAGQFLVSVAQAQMLGAEFWTGLDRRRDDTAGEALSAVPTPASTTATTLAARFGAPQLAGIEEGIGEICCRVMGLLPARRRAVLRAGTTTIDLDGTDVECYGSRKDGIAYTYKGMRAGRPHVATWAEAGLVTAADLLAAHERASRLNNRVQHLEKRLSQALGEQVWRESGLGVPADIDALNQRITYLEQQAVDLRIQLDERNDDLVAARAANRELMAQLNTPTRHR